MGIPVPCERAPLSWASVSIEPSERIQSNVCCLSALYVSPDYASGVGIDYKGQIGNPSQHLDIGVVDELSVDARHIVPGDAESTDGCLVFNAAMRSIEVISTRPVFEACGSLV